MMLDATTTHLPGGNLRVGQAILIMVLVIVAAKNQLMEHPSQASPPSYATIKGCL